VTRVPAVLDASALLAFANDEPGADRVRPLLAGAYMSALNWCEVVERALAWRLDVIDLRIEAETAGLEIVPFDTADAERAATLREATRRHGLGIADRACLALAQRLGVAAVTADRSWTSLELDVEIVAIR
jgi:PIN domain nuclease of toxin-antitoxin system